MKDNPQEERKFFNTLTLFALMIRCPTGMRATRTCPFARFREHYKSEEKYRLAERLSGEQGQKMLAAHEACQAKKYGRSGPIRTRLEE
jgi:hypothetical protein